jgi:LacI family transcriptional regulator
LDRRHVSSTEVLVAATIGDVAERAGVSTATVSRVLSGANPARPETRARVMAAVEALDYRPSGVARSLKLRTTRTMGLLITDILNPYFPELVRAVEDAARAIGYSVLLCNGDEDAEREAAYLELLAERRVDGILIAASRMTSRHARWLERSAIPIVVMNSGAPDPGIPSVRSDNVHGGRLAVEHLLALGHRSLGYLAGPQADDAQQERLAGVRAGLAAGGLDPDTLSLGQGDGHVAGGARAATEILASDAGLTGIVCYNDLSAIGAIRAVRAAGRRVPADVSIVGFDDIDQAEYVDPPLTTIRQRTAEMGRWAVASLAARLARPLAATTGSGTDSGDGPRPLVAPVGELLLPVDLIVRKSTGPVPHGRGRETATTRNGGRDDPDRRRQTRSA